MEDLFYNLWQQPHVDVWPRTLPYQTCIIFAHCRTTCARAWCVALTLLQRWPADEELNNILLSKENLKFLRDIGNTLLSVPVNELCSDERASVTLTLILLLIDNETLMSKLFRNENIDIFRVTQIDKNDFATALADMMVYLVYWRMNVAGNEHTRKCVARAFSSQMKPSRNTCLQILKVLLVRMLSEGGRSVASARRSLLKDLLDRCATPTIGGLSSLIGAEMASATILACLHPDMGSYSHVRGRRLLMRFIKHSRRSPIKWHIPPPPTEFRDVICAYFENPQRGLLIPRFVDFMSEKNLRQWSHILEGSDDSIRIRAWHDLFKEVTQTNTHPHHGLICVRFPSHAHITKNPVIFLSTHNLCSPHRFVNAI